MKKRPSDEQIFSILCQAEAGVSTGEIYLKHIISDTTFHSCAVNLAAKKYRLKSPEENNACLRKLLTEAILDTEAIHVALSRKF